ncbi:hypothetical protein ABW19_dt0206243 [Dactylella cylindrospora]|nr:hypothetical protein ABW19_dt0206243 [Dactylella cylindrospora]
MSSMTTTTTTITNSPVPTPSNLFIFGSSTSYLVDIDSSGNLILASPVNLSSAFILNADGSLVSYGSDLDVFADFTNIVAERALDAAYALGCCFSQSTQRRLRGLKDDVSVHPRQIGSDGKAYTQFSISSGLLQFSTNGSSWGFVTCGSNLLEIYDLQSDGAPASCTIVSLGATSISTSQYATYYSAGTTKASQYTDIATCSSASSSTSTLITTTSSRTSSFTSYVTLDPDDFTTQADLADWTSTGNPYPVFAVAVFDVGLASFNNIPLQLVLLGGDDINLNTIAFRLNAAGELNIHGAPYKVFANTSVDVVDASDERAVCDVSHVNLVAAGPDDTVPSGAATGPFIADPDIGLVLQDYYFIVCTGVQYLQVIAEGCTVPTDCVIVNPAVYRLSGDFADDAAFNAYFIFGAPAATTYSEIPPTTTTTIVQETGPVAYARDVLLEGSYVEFCSSELTLYATTTDIETVTTTITTVGTDTVSTHSIINYSALVTTTISTAARTQTTRISSVTSIITYYKTYPTRIFTTATVTNTTTSLSGTNTIIYFNTTLTSFVTNVIFVTTTAVAVVKRGEEFDIERRTQDRSLTPTQLQAFAPSIIAEACSSYLTELVDNYGVPVSTFTYHVEVTTTLNGTALTVTTTSITSPSTSYGFAGTTTVFVYTTTSPETSVTTIFNTNYLTSNASQTLTAVDTITALNVVRLAYNRTLTVS